MLVFSGVSACWSTVLQPGLFYRLIATDTQVVPPDEADSQSEHKVLITLLYEHWKHQWPTVELHRNKAAEAVDWKAARYCCVGTQQPSFRGATLRAASMLILIYCLLSSVLVAIEIKD